MLNKIKRYFILLIPLILPSLANARSILENLTGPGDATGLGAIGTLVNNVQTIITDIAGAIAVLMIVVGGVVYITSAGNTEKAEQGKKYLTYAIIGLIMVITAKILLRIFANILGGNFS